MPDNVHLITERLSNEELHAHEQRMFLRGLECPIDQLASVLTIRNFYHTRVHARITMQEKQRVA